MLMGPVSGGSNRKSYNRVSRWRTVVEIGDIYVTDLVSRRIEAQDVVAMLQRAPR